MFSISFSIQLLEKECFESDLLWWLSVITISVVELMDTSTLLCFVCLWHRPQSQSFCLLTIFSLQISPAETGGLIMIRKT